MGECLSCKFFIEGECRRYPPTHHGFPGVRPESWCGDYAERVDEKPGGHFMPMVEPEKPKRRGRKPRNAVQRPK